MDQPGKVVISARGQMNRENEYFPVRVRKIVRINTEDDTTSGKPLKRFDIFPPDWGMLIRSRCVQIFL